MWALVPAPTSIRPPSHVSFVQLSAGFGGSNLCSSTVANVAVDVATAHSLRLDATQHFWRMAALWWLDCAQAGDVAAENVMVVSTCSLCLGALFFFPVTDAATVCPVGANMYENHDSLTPPGSIRCCENQRNRKVRCAIIPSQNYDDPIAISNAISSPFQG